MPFWVIPDVGLNVNLNTQGAKSVTAYLQAERASVSHLAPALFSSKGVNLGTGTRGLRGQKPRDASCTVVSEKDFCSPCLVKALSLTTPLKTHYSLFRLTCSLAPVGFVITSSDLTLVHRLKNNVLFTLFISWLPPVFLLNLKTYTLNVWTEMQMEHLYNLSCAWEGNCNLEVKTNV